MNALLAAYRHTSNKRAELESRSVCGGCTCVENCAPTEIVAWTDL